MARVQRPLPRSVHRLLQASALPAALALLATPALQAQPVPGPAQIERQQQERLRELQERALPQPAPGEGTDLQRIAPQVVVPQLTGCVAIRELRIEGSTRLRPAIRAEAQVAATGCLGSLQIEALLAALTKEYIDRGYVTARIYVEAQDLSQGVLRLRVVEGTIERYETVKEDAREDRPDRLWLAGAFPAQAGELLNLRDLEQGIDQLNTLQSNRATLELRPGTLPGQSVVVVRNNAGSPLNLYLSYDNLGSPATGEDNLGATLSFNSVLGLNELIAFTRNQTTPRGSDHQSDSSAVRVAIPYGYWTLALDTSHSDYTNGLDLPSGLPLLATGRTVNHGVSLARVVYRDQSSRATLSGRLGSYDTRNYMAGQLLEVSSRKLAPLDLGATLFSQVAGGIGNVRVGYVRGLRAFGALHDEPGLPEDYPRAQFSKFTFDLGYQRRLQAGTQPLQWTAQASGQYSRDPLFGSQQFLVGSPATVRGSRLASLSGDHGALLRNDIAWLWRVPAAGNDPVFGTVYAGYDVGWVGNRAPASFEGSMAGLTLGVTARWRGAAVDLFASRILRQPAAFADEGTLAGVRLSWSL